MSFARQLKGITYLESIDYQYIESFLQILKHTAPPQVRDFTRNMYLMYYWEHKNCVCVTASIQ